MTKVPVIHIEEGRELWLWCEWCHKTTEPKRSFLGKSDMGFDYEDAACASCGKQIAGIVVEKKKEVGPCQTGGNSTATGKS